MYAVLAIKKTVTINMWDVERDISLVWADGMIGALACFETREQAEAYSGESCQVVEMQYKSKEIAAAEQLFDGLEDKS